MVFVNYVIYCFLVEENVCIFCNFCVVVVLGVMFMVFDFFFDDDLE